MNSTKVIVVDNTMGKYIFNGDFSKQFPGGYDETGSGNLGGGTINNIHIHGKVGNYAARNYGTMSSNGQNPESEIDWDSIWVPDDTIEECKFWVLGEPDTEEEEWAIEDLERDLVELQKIQNRIERRLKRMNAEFGD